MIQSVEIRNFRNIRDQRIELGPLTVFVGPNGSGKTSVLEAVYLAVSSAAESPRPFEEIGRHPDWLYTRGGHGDLRIACQSETDEFALMGSLGSAGQATLTFTLEPDQTLFGQDLPLSWLAPVDFLRLDASRLAEPSYSDDDPPRMQRHGDGLASVLAYMALSDPDAFHELSSHMQGLIPRLQRIRFRKAIITRTEKEYVRIDDEAIERQTNRSYRGEEILFDFANALDLPAHAVSEGTLILLGLLTTILGPSHPRLLLVDDLDRGLHPLVQRSLVEVLRQLQTRFPGLQILATTHSPYLLDELKHEEVRLMAVDEDGSAVCGRLENHPRFNTWRAEMAPGELWSLFGEKWLVQGVAAR